jgi:hypothetical protein
VPRRLHDALFTGTVNPLPHFVSESKLEISGLCMGFVLRRNASAFLNQGIDRRFAWLLWFRSYRHLLTLSPVCLM